MTLIISRCFQSAELFEVFIFTVLAIKCFRNMLMHFKTNQ